MDGVRVGGGAARRGGGLGTFLRNMAKGSARWYG